MKLFLNLYIIYILCLNLNFYFTLNNSKQKQKKQDTLNIEQIKKSLENNKIILYSDIDIESNLLNNNKPKNNIENKIIYQNQNHNQNQMKKKEILLFPLDFNEKNSIENFKKK
jgi:hypothetical protein